MQAGQPDPDLAAQRLQRLRSVMADRGLSGEYPYVPLHEPHTEYPLPGCFEPGMVICIESYIGDADHGRGVKLEDQFLVTEYGADPMSTLAFDPKLTG